MKVLELCLADNLGGLELYFQQCRNTLEEKSIDLISVVSINGRLKSLPSRGTQLELERGRKWFPYAAAKKLSKIIVENEIEIVHIHHAHDLALGSLTKRICPRDFQLVFTRHMNLPHSKKDLYHRWVYSQYDLFLVITDKLRDQAIARLPIKKEKIVRIYLGTEDPPKYSKYECDKLFDSEKFNIGVFSRIEFLKGQHTVIESIEHLKSGNLNPHLYLYGDIMDNEYYKKLEKRIKELNLGDSITFMGFQENAKEIMGCLDVVILPSEGETFGLVVVESMRAGTPVIATRAGGVPEIIDHEETGFLFDFEDAKALSGYISELIYDPSRRKKMAAAAKTKADEVFTVERHYELLIQQLQGLIG